MKVKLILERATLEMRIKGERYRKVKENEELRNNGFTVSAMTEQHLKAAIEKGEQLEKENEELDMKRKAERKIFQGIVEKKNENLTKAKEILQLFLKLKITPCASGNSINMFQFENVCNQAEQFLKEIEK